MNLISLCARQNDVFVLYSIKIMWVDGLAFGLNASIIIVCAFKILFKINF